MAGLPQGVEIRPVAEAHVASLRKAVGSVARERRFLAILRAFPIEATRQFVRENLKRRNPHFVALAGGRVIGWCDIQVNPRHAMAHSGLLGMGVMEGFRGKGVGAALMAATLEHARKRGVTRVELTVRDDNRRAIALYRKFGFVREGLHRRAFLIDGRYYNLMSMAVLFKRSNAS